MPIARPAFPVAVLLAACATATGHHVSDAPEPDGSGAAATRRAGNADAHAVRIDEVELNYTLEADGRVTTTVHQRYELLSNEAPADLAEVAMAYRPWFQARPKLEATVTTASGQVLNLDPRTFAEGPAATSPEQFSDAKVVRAPLPGLARGARVDLRVSREDLKPLLDNAGRMIRMPLAWGTDVGHVRITLDAPSNLSLQTQLDRSSVSPSKSSHDGRSVTTWDFERLEAVKPGEPNSGQTFPVLYVGTGKSWSDVANVYGKVLAPIASSPSLSVRAKELTKSATTPNDKAIALLEWLHKNVRYTAMELGAGSLVPRTPDETVAKGFGDCKDMATLMVTMLRAVGVSAHVALLDASIAPDIASSVGGFGEFNHAIVRVDGPKPVWIDPTFPFGAPNILPPLDQGRHALVIADNTKALETTPVLTSADNRRVVTYELRFSEYGTGHLKRVEEDTGLSFVTLRAAAFADPDRYAQEVEKRWRRIYGAKGDITATHTDPLVLGKPYRETVEVDTDQAHTYERNAQASLAVSVIIESLPFNIDREKDEQGHEKKQQTRLELAIPAITQLEWKLIPSPGFVPQELPAPQDRRFGPAHFTSSYTAANDGTVTVRLMLDTGAKLYSAADVEAVRDGLTAAYKELTGVVTFDNKVSLLLEKGQVKDALKLAQQLAQANPKSSAVRGFLSRALRAAHAGDLARAEAKKAVELNPKSSTAHRIYGDLLRADALGLSTARPEDHAPALAELMQAWTLEPEEALNSEYAALLNEYDDRWEWFGAKANVKQARAIYEQYREKKKDGALDSQYARLLFQTGDYSALIKLKHELKNTMDIESAYLAAITMTQGPKEALTVARREVPEKKQMGEAVGGAFARMLQVREYGKARELLFLLANETGGQIEKFRVALERMARFPKGPVTDARGAVLAVFRAAIENDEAKVASLMEPTPNPKDLIELMKLRNLRQGLLSAFGVDTLSTDAAIDMLATAPEWSTERIDGIGELVTMADAIKGTKTEILVVTVKGVRKVHVGSELPSALGVDAMDRLSRGDVAGATKVIELARRIHKPEGSIGKLLDKANDADSVKLAAAGLALNGANDHMDTAFDVLTKAMAGEKRAKRHETLRTVLAGAFIRHHRGGELLKLADDFADSDDEESEDYTRYLALSMLNRHDEARELALKVATKSHDNTEWLTKSAWSAARSGKFEVATQLFERVLVKSPDDAGALNDVAWYSLFSKVDDKAIARAERATMLTKNERDNELGTLACLYAHVGRVDDALRTVNQMMDLDNDFASGHISRWYAMGRIDEGLGLNDEARKAFARVQEDPDRPNDDLSGLAKARLLALGPGANVVEPLAQSTKAAAPVAKKVALAKPKKKAKR